MYSAYKLNKQGDSIQPLGPLNFPRSSDIAPKGSLGCHQELQPMKILLFLIYSNVLFLYSELPRGDIVFLGTHIISLFGFLLSDLSNGNATTFPVLKFK